MKQSGNKYTFLPFAQNVGIRIFPKIVLKSGPDTKTEKEISGHDPQFLIGLYVIYMNFVVKRCANDTKRLEF